jgi:hypothetical protein
MKPQVLSTLWALALTAGVYAAAEAPVVLAEKGAARAVIVADRELLPRRGEPAKAQYVRLTQSSDRVMVAEVEVFSGGVNVAKGKSATQKGVWKAGYEADKAVDGNTYGETAPKEGKANSTISTEPGGWWEVDLGQAVPIEKVVVWNLTDSNAPRQVGLMVSLLDDQRATVGAGSVAECREHWEFADFAPPLGNADAGMPAALAALREYLQRVTGAEFALKAFGEERPEDTCIYLYKGAAARLGLDTAKLAPEEWLVKTRGGDLYLTGGDAGGASLAVYHFLEDLVGVRWWTDQEESVPSRPDLVIPPTHLNHTPAFPERTAAVPPGRRFAAGNGFHADEGNYIGIRCHALFSHAAGLRRNEWLAVDKDGKVMVAGTGAVDLCYSKAGDEAAAILAEGIVRTAIDIQASRRAAGLRVPTIVNLGREDCAQRCQCAECAKAPTIADLQVGFINKVAARVKEKCPDVLLEIYAYLDMKQPPRLVKPADNVLVLYATDSMILDKGIFDRSNARHLGLLEEWSRMSSGTKVWHYPRTYSNLKGAFDLYGRGGEEASYGTNCRGSHDMPVPNVFHFGDMLRAFHRNRVTHLYFENEENPNRDLREIKTWVLGKLMQDPYQDDLALIDTFCAGYYGPAGQQVRAYLDLLLAKANEHPGHVGWMPELGEYRYFDDDFFVRSQALFADAEKALSGTPDEGMYLRRLRWAWCSATRPFLARWPVTANEWVGSGKRIADYPLDRDAIFTKYKTAYEQGLRFYVYPTGAERLDEQLANHFALMDGRFIELPVPEQFRDVPRQFIYDFPVDANEMYCDYGTVRERDPALGRDVFVIRDCKDLWPLKFYSAKYGGSQVLREIADVAELRPNEYAWYSVGTNRFSGWEGHHVRLFSAKSLGLAHPGHIVVPVTDTRAIPYETWIEMKVVPGADGKPKEIRLARALVLTKEALQARAPKTNELATLAGELAKAPVRGRFVRVEHHNQYLCIAEVEVFSGGANLALKKKATQSSVSPWGGPPELAVDGNPSGDWNDGSVTHTGNSADEWWEVDLGATVPIERIVYHNRTNHQSDWVVGTVISILDETRNVLWRKTINKPLDAGGDTVGF